MLRGAVVVGTLAALWAPAAHACEVQASPPAGPAPLTVTYTALCESSAYRWSFADGTTADGVSVVHTWTGGGRFGGTLTTDAATDPLPQASAFRVTLAAPRVADWRDGVVFSGTLAPGPGGVSLYRHGRLVTATRTDARGRFRMRVRLTDPGPYVARAAGASSKPVTVRVRPRIETRVVGAPVLGGRISVVARVRPAKAGKARVTIDGRARRSLRVDGVGPLRVRVRTVPRAGWAPAARTLSVAVRHPALAAGDAGTAVLALERRLHELHFALAGVDSRFDEDTADAVVAFQKLAGLPRTGRADAAVWRALANARPPRPRGGGNRIEVDKERQLLYLVRGGRLALVVPVSTAGLPGRFTPEGSFAVYRKVTGWDNGPLGVLYDPMYFTGGYAIHGSPSVPPYPASHGCVRVPMWIAARLYETVPYGERVDVY